MADIFDYLVWRGDLDMKASPFCDVDYAILCRMSYLPFDGLVSEDIAPQLTIGNAARLLLDRAAAVGGSFFRMEEDMQLLELLKSSPRFADCRLGGFMDVFSEADEEQFSAVAVFLTDGTVALTFRGTDGTIIGWKEDFDLAVSDAVPAQLDAVRYANRAAKEVKRMGLRLGGHSKGGNLAVYAAARCSAAARRRILTVRNFDGPGFHDDMLASEGFLAVKERMRTILPCSSVIGMLLEHSEEFSIIDSKSMGIFQHNIYRWQVMGGAFVFMEELTDSSRFMDATTREWVAAMSREERARLVDGLFAVIGAGDGRTLRDLWSGRNLVAIFKAARGMDEETKAILTECFQKLGASAKSALPLLLDRAEEKPA